jgi:hypothetical protein
MFAHARRALLGLLLVAAAWTPATAQDKKFAVKTGTAEPPKELSAAVKKLLGNSTLQFYDPSGALVCEIWLSKELPADATPEQIKNGLTYRELKETTVVGAVRFDQAWQDYRKQKVKAGVYTLRLGFQPPDGDHSGKSMFTEFVLLSSAEKDMQPDPMEPKKLIEMSSKSIDAGHPAVFMLAPNSKPGKTAVETRSIMGHEHWIVNTSIAVNAGGKKGTLGLGLTLVGEPDE